MNTVFPFLGSIGMLVAAVSAEAMFPLAVKECPLLFTQNVKAFASIYGSILTRDVNNDCHNCIKQKSMLYGLNSDVTKSAWSCWQIILAAVRGNDGCATQCLYQDSTQCMFYGLQNTLIELTPACSSCMTTYANCSKDSVVSCQSICRKNCGPNCMFPTSCTLPAPPINFSALSLCQQCLGKFTGDDLTVRQQCLVSGANGGCSDVCVRNCGDGIVTQPVEQCDDGQAKGGDGCSAFCKVEAGFICTGQPSRCTPICGDGLLVGNEACDDGNRVDGDGCSSVCGIEKGFSCKNGGVHGTASVCSEICGDGIIVGKEQCDDGNTKSGDGCSSICAVEAGFTCVTQATGISICSSPNQTNVCQIICGRGLECVNGVCKGICGDSIVAGVESCDDGNTRDGDGCSSTCQIEPNTDNLSKWSCLTPGSPCVATCRGPRIRKPWTHLTQAEKQLYIEAVQLAMDAGLYALFVGIHFESANDMEAHQTCAFLTWHRRFLTAFENMLRNRGVKYACVTIPYWDYFSDYAKFITGSCGSMLDCSDILKELGGNDGNFASVNVPGSGNYAGSCSTGAPLNHACPVFSSSSGDGDCLNCIPRGDYRMPFPSGLGYASAAGSISVSRYSDLNAAIQNSYHNTVHNALGGLMLSMASPADPIFFSHHCTIDMMYQLYYTCTIGKKLSAQEKQQDPRVFEGCVYDGNAIFPGSTSTIEQRVFYNGTFILAQDHPKIGQYFKDLGTEHYEFVDASDLGIHSYSYDVDSLLQSLLGAGYACVNVGNVFADDSGLRSPTDDGRFPPLQDESSYKTTYLSWYKQIYDGIQRTNEYTIQKNDEDKLKYTMEQIQAIECMHYDRNYRVLGNGDSFKQSFQVKGAGYCREIVDDIHQGKMHIYYQNWQRDCNLLLQPQVQKQPT